jgi:hypothetical protein
VTATSGCKAWAVGSYVKAGVSHTLIEYWNGSRWWVQRSPNPGRYGNGLVGVSASSPINIWAVGYKRTRKYGDQQTLILHWNGKAWAVRRSPNPGPHGDSLRGVATTSATNAWAVGSANYGGRSTDYPRIGEQPLILHWDGTGWRAQTSPIFPPHPREDCCQAQTLNDVAAISRSDAWAVGYIDHGWGWGPKGLIEHWNGKTWTVQPAIGNDYSQVSGAAQTSPTNAWAVGTYAVNYCGSSGCTSWSKGLVGRWNGKAWKVQKSPSPGRFGSLTAVAQTSSASAWAVGSIDHRLAAQTLIEHWAGRTWTRQNSPNPGRDNHLFSVATTSPTNAWAVGESGSGKGMRTLALHWDGTGWR